MKNVLIGLAVALSASIAASATIAADKLLFENTHSVFNLPAWIGFAHSARRRAAFQNVRRYFEDEGL